MQPLEGTYPGEAARFSNLDFGRMGRLVSKCQERAARRGGYIYCSVTGVGWFLLAAEGRPQVPALRFPRAMEILDFTAFFAPAWFLPRLYGGAR